MMRDFFNMHLYLTLNLAIIASYLLARGLTAFPGLKTRIKQLHQLKFVRIFLLISMVIFLIMPSLSRLAAVSAQESEFQPVFHHAALLFDKSRDAVALPLTAPKSIPMRLPAMNLMLIFLVTGIGIAMLVYLRNIFKLIKTVKQAYCLHHIHQVRVLLSPDCNTAFCWSLPGRHYILLPEYYLEHPADKQLAIRHELQHLRHGDTAWLHVMQTIKWICFWNPFVYLWTRWINELQEFACDEQIILRKTTAPDAYAQCLVNAAQHILTTGLPSSGVIAINGFSKSILHRRVNMIFSYKNQPRSLIMIFVYLFSLFFISTAALAVNGASETMPLSAAKISALLNPSKKYAEFDIKATPEVVAEINRIRTQKQARTQFLAALKRMKEYQTYLVDEFKSKSMPVDLLALPLIESGYRPLGEEVNPVRAAGIWQIIPSTGKRLGLVITSHRDDRMDMKRATHAALAYLNDLYKQFHDWKLAVVAYEIGENQTALLIQETGSHDPQVLANSSSLSEKYRTELKKYLAMFDAAVIIINHPDLINASS